MCTHGADQARGDFFWFVNENYYETETIVDLRRSYGFCPLHTRQLLRTGASSVITTVSSYLTDYALSRLQEAQALITKGSSDRESDRCRQASTVLRPQGICRVCRSLQWGESYDIHIILRALPDKEVQAACRESAGLCLPHFRQAALEAEWDLLSFLTGDMWQRLKAIAVPGDSHTALFEQVQGLDRERSIRRREGACKTSNLPIQGKEPITLTIEQASGAHVLPWLPTFEQALTALTEPGCPVCIACKRGLRDYIGWLAQDLETKTSPSAHWDPAWQVCPAHFWELCAAGHEGAAVLVAERVRQDWLSKLAMLSAGMARRPAVGLTNRLAAVPVTWSRQLSAGGVGLRGRIHHLWRVAAEELESPQHKLDRLRTIAFREDHCQACYHIQETTRRTLDLILRVVEEPTGRKAYSQAWGLCLRHCIAAARIAEAPAALNELLTAQITRLRILEWELKETSRKHNWSVRYEPTGPEAGAWERAAHQFCGSILWERR